MTMPVRPFFRRQVSVWRGPYAPAPVGINVDHAHGHLPGRSRRTRARPEAESASSRSQGECADDASQMLDVDILTDS
ncbi:MAG: hypothetical protein ACLP1X_33700, partial [Polyangiaceae bacterium]